jgi:hypothetical protein
MMLRSAKQPVTSYLLFSYLPACDLQVKHVVILTTYPISGSYLFNVPTESASSEPGSSTISG